MSYLYSDLRDTVFTEDGQVRFLAIRDNTRYLLDKAGAVSMEKAIAGQSGDVWKMMACVDRLVELGELREITAEQQVAGQHRIFVDVKR